MVTFDTLELKGDTPIYLQIIHHIKAGLVAGTMVHGDELPSRRQVSTLLGVNPNTIQKAYKQLEEEGFLLSHTGAKSTIQITEEQVFALKTLLIEEDIGSIIEHLKAFGVEKEEALVLLDKFWEVGS